MLVETLIQEQEKRGMTDRAFAATLGIQRASWTLIRLGHRNLTEPIARAVIRAYPDLAPMAVAFLMNPDQKATGGEVVRR